MKKKGIKRAVACMAIALSFVLAGAVVTPAAAPSSVEVQASETAAVKISKTKLSLYVKKRATLKISGTSAKVTWTSSNKKVATVSRAGKVTAVKKGTATITAKVGKKKYTCKVTVKNPVLSAKTATVNVGKTKQLKVTGAVGTVKWASGNKAVATVNSKGLVKGVKAGTATITATASGVKLNCKVTVKPIAVTGVTLNQTSGTVIIGKQLKLTATVAPSTATNKKVIWSSSNTAIATVTDAGVVTAKAVGTATITAKTADGGKTATCKVTVKPIAVTGVTLNQTSASIIIGNKETLTATVAPSTATNKKVIWSSSNTAIATVTGAGVVTAKAVGTATITAKTADGGKTATCKVTVKSIAVEGVILSRTSLVLAPEGEFALSATFVPADATNRTVIWTSSDSGVAEVSEDGVVTAKAVGTATITVTTKDGNKTATCEVTVAETAGYIQVSLASEPDTLDPALSSSVDGATMLTHLFSGLAKYVQKNDGTVEIVPDMAEELVAPASNDNGTYTYTYTLRNAVWSDGRPVTADDFVYAWNRAANTSPSGYLYNNVDGYGGEALNIRAVDEKTFEVTTKGNYSYWNELLTFPAFFPVRKDIVEGNDNWAKDPSTYVSNGMYTMKTWDHNQVLIMSKNENHPDADSVTMPGIYFHLSEGAEGMLEKFRSGELLMIDDVVAGTVSKDDPEYHVQGTLGTYYFSWNAMQDLSPDGKTLSPEQQADVRNALNLLIDRNSIVNDIIGGAQVPASSFVAMGFTEPDGSQFYQKAGNSQDYYGYYSVDPDSQLSNEQQAMEILSQYYTIEDGMIKDFPILTCIYNESTMHARIAEAVKQAFAKVGIQMECRTLEWREYLTEVTNGNFSIARGGWVADYNDALSFLDLFQTDSGNNHPHLGQGSSGETQYTVDLSDLGRPGLEGNWNQTYDQLIQMIISEPDLETRNTLLHKAEDLLMKTGCVCPIYFYTDTYMLSSRVSGFFSTPTGGKYFMYTTIN